MRRIQRIAALAVMGLHHRAKSNGVNLLQPTHAQNLQNLSQHR